MAKRSKMDMLTEIIETTKTHQDQAALSYTSGEDMAMNAPKVLVSFRCTASVYENLKALALYRSFTTGAKVGYGSLLDEAAAEYLERHSEELKLATKGK